MPEPDTVLAYSRVVATFGQGHTRWMLRCGRWQSPRWGVVATHLGTLTREEQFAADLVSCGSGAVLAGLTAATVDGFTGFVTPTTHVLLPSGLKRAARDGIIVHRSAILTDLDIHPTRRPTRTRTARSIVDVASWQPLTRWR